MKEVYLREPIGRAFIEYLGTLGELQYLGGLAHPFFRADIPGKYHLSGIQGRKRLRAVLDRENPGQALSSLKELLTSFRSEEPERQSTDSLSS